VKELKLVNNRFLFFFLLLSLTVASQCAAIDLKPSQNDYYLEGKLIMMLEDSDKSLDFRAASSPAKQSSYKPMRDFPVQLLDASKVYWLRIDLQNPTEDVNSDWVLEFLDFRISHLDLYTQISPDKYLHQTVGFSYPVSMKEFQHKNFVFSLPKLGKGVSHVYARLVSNTPVTARARISSIHKFHEYSLNEYYFLSLYYGVCLAMLVYNLFLFFSIQDRTYLYYIFYITGAIFFSFSRDGLGFHFIWPNYPVLNHFMFNFSNMFMVFWEVMYARSFLNSKNTQPLLDKVLKWVLAIRILIFVVTSTILPEYGAEMSFDLVILGILFVAGFKIANKKYLPANYYLLAFSWLLLGYFVFNLTNMGLIKHNVYTVYSANFGIVGEMMLLSFALASRIKILQKEKIDAQNETIKQLVLNEELKDSINKDLEEKVLERTLELEMKNKELDAFVYKSSHDLKGPLNSIVGLATIGMMTNDLNKAREYFKHTSDTAKRLQSTIIDLLSLTKVKETTVIKKPVKIVEMLDEVVENFAHDENYVAVDIRKKIEAEKDLVTDESLVRSILQNLVENGLKYRDPEKNKQTLDIYLKNKNGHFIMQVKDNGLGISETDKEKVFDMFYKINPKSHGSGLGLHILKTAVQKLGGEISLESERGKGSTFTVKLPNEN
jgi:signal transduction histidine kinase